MRFIQIHIPFVPPTEIPLLPGRIRFYATFRSDVLTRGRLNFIGFWAWKRVTIDRRLVANHLSRPPPSIALVLIFERRRDTLCHFWSIKRKTNTQKNTTHLYHHEFRRRSKRCWRIRRGRGNHWSFQQVRVDFDWLIDWLNVLDRWDGLCFVLEFIETLENHSLFFLFLYFLSNHPVMCVQSTKRLQELSTWLWRDLLPNAFLEPRSWTFVNLDMQLWKLRLPNCTKKRSMEEPLIVVLLFLFVFLWMMLSVIILHYQPKKG